MFLALHNVFVQVAAEYGFGQDQRTLSLDDGANAHKFELVGQSFVIVGMGMAKISLALFLLRVVVVRWQRITIWAVGGSLMFASFMTGILCWLQVRGQDFLLRHSCLIVQCLPAKRIYDRRVDGRCIIDPVPWAILLGGKTAATARACWCSANAWQHFVYLLISFLPCFPGSSCTN